VGGDGEPEIERSDDNMIGLADLVKVEDFVEAVPLTGTDELSEPGRQAGSAKDRQPRPLIWPISQRVMQSQEIDAMVGMTMRENYRI
jgi:hypothetical protein